MVVSNIFYIHPYLGKIPNFSMELKPPTRKTRLNHSGCFFKRRVFFFNSWGGLRYAKINWLLKKVTLRKDCGFLNTNELGPDSAVKL